MRFKMVFSTLLAMVTVCFSAHGAGVPNSNYSRPSIDLYEVLGVAKNSWGDDIKNAYRKLARKYHPDFFEKESPAVKGQAAERFKAINQAYDVLSNSARRDIYDRYGLVGNTDGSDFVHPEPSPVDQPLEDFLADIFGRGAGANPGANQNMNRGFANSGFTSGTRAPYHWPVGAIWDPRRNQSENYLHGLLSSDIGPVRDYFLYSLVNNDWRTDVGARSVFTNAAFEIIKKNIESAPTNMTPYARILTLPMTGYFPEVVEAMFEKYDAVVAKAFITDLVPRLNSNQDRKTFVRYMTSKSDVAIARVLAEHIPITNADPNYATEFEQLIHFDDPEILQTLDFRLRTFFALSAKNAFIPGDYRRIADEVRDRLGAASEAANSKRDVKIARPSDWFSYHKTWNDKTSYISNVVDTLLITNPITSPRSYAHILALAKDIDWATPGSPGQKQFAWTATRHVTVLSNLEKFSESQVRENLARIIALPMAPYATSMFDDVIKRTMSPYQRDFIFGTAIDEMAKHPHWLESPLLKTWIGRLNTAGSYKAIVWLYKLRSPGEPGAACSNLFH